MKGTILLTLGMASFFWVFGVRPVNGSVEVKFHRQELYKDIQSNQSIEDRNK